MCRFMMVRAENPISPRGLLEKFSHKSRASRSFDGDWQGDGWGISYLKKKSDSCPWEIYRSLTPIWEDKDTFARFPDSKVFCVHARSASFAEHKGCLEHNQPYLDGKYAFVFNGLLRGVRLPRALQGDIGAQKIWSLLQTYLKDDLPDKALDRLQLLLSTNSREIQALNIGISDGDRLYALNYFTRHPEYYRLHRHTSSSLKIIASEPLEGYSWDSFEFAGII